MKPAILTTILTVGFLIVWTDACAQEALPETNSYDIVVYGGTSAGVIAAVQAKQMDKSVVIVGPDKHLGGLTSGGLGWTDTGNKAVIGGLSRDFYHRIWKKYQSDDAWKQQSREQYGNKGQGTKAIDGANRTMWIFEPHVAEAVYEDYVREFDIPVFRNEWLDRESGVEKENSRISALTMLSGKTFRGKVFVDATYEGDLMAAAGVSYHVGREGKDVYGEQWNGVQTGVLHHAHHFGNLEKPVSPYIDPSDSNSGVLARISTELPGEKHSGDHRIQAYCFRMCLTNHPDNRIPFEKPEGYDPSQYELLVRIYEAGWDATFGKFDPIPNFKTDTNNHGPMSTDNIGYNYGYPDGSYEERNRIIKEHETYQKGWLYFICNDPRVPDNAQNEMKNWGLPKDEFVDNGNWPHQLYIREARRMLGEYVMTERELLKKQPTPRSIGMGSYTMDSHNVQRYITPEGSVQNEGDIGVSTNGPYEIAYGSLVPKKEECENLFVPVCVSSSHIAFGSIRMEPVFMILGQSAATAAAMAIEKGIAVQDIDYHQLSTRLKKDGQVLHYDGPIMSKKRQSVPVETLLGVVVDDDDADRSGIWKSSRSSSKFVGHGYRHDDARGDGESSATFKATLPMRGSYEVRLAYPANANRASNLKVDVVHAEGSKSILIDQKKTPAIDKTFSTLGIYSFSPEIPASVVVRNADTNGYVVIDAVQWIRVESEPNQNVR